MISLPMWAVVLISLIAIIIVIVATWAYFTAQRLHRLHKRCEQAAISLQGTLDRRAVAARMVARAMRRVAAEGDRDPSAATAIVTEANTISHTAHIAEASVCRQLFDLRPREDAENDLTLVLRRCNFRCIDREEVAELQEAAIRVSLARRFYNNAVQEVLSLQTAPVVRTLRLAGYVPTPHFFNIIDESGPAVDPAVDPLDEDCSLGQNPNTVQQNEESPTQGGLIS